MEKEELAAARRQPNRVQAAAPIIAIRPSKGKLAGGLHADLVAWTGSRMVIILSYPKLRGAHRIYHKTQSDQAQIKIAYLVHALRGA
jgi:hypothetical protein